MIVSTRASCAITDPEDDTIIVTGGRDTPQEVTRYDASGNKTSMPPLNGGRNFHACGSYKRSSDNKLVIFLSILILSKIKVFAGLYCCRRTQDTAEGILRNFCERRIYRMDSS